MSSTHGWPKPGGWRSVLKIHPAAEIDPLMSAPELHALGEDIKKNGLQSHTGLDLIIGLGGETCAKSSATPVTADTAPRKIASSPTGSRLNPTADLRRVCMVAIHLETKATARAVKASDAAVKSSKALKKASRGVIRHD
jgi:hypothetical protein